MPPPTTTTSRRTTPNIETKQMLLGRLKKYQEATRSFHRDLLRDNKKVIQAHNQVRSSRGVLMLLLFGMLFGPNSLLEREPPPSPRHTPSKNRSGQRGGYCKALKGSMLVVNKTCWEPRSVASFVSTEDDSLCKTRPQIKSPSPGNLIDLIRATTVLIVAKTEPWIPSTVFVVAKTQKPSTPSPPIPRRPPRPAGRACHGVCRCSWNRQGFSRYRTGRILGCYHGISGATPAPLRSRSRRSGSPTALPSCGSSRRTTRRRPWRSPSRPAFREKSPLLLLLLLLVLLLLLLLTRWLSWYQSGRYWWWWCCR